MSQGHDSQSMPPPEEAEFVLGFLARLNERNVDWAYLRNYEELPSSVGNDVDLLVRSEASPSILRILQEFAAESGWSVRKMVPFSPLSVYLLPNHGARGALHIDFFDRLEWHLVPYADVDALIRRRRMRQGVWVLDEADETYVNVMTRLLYAGVVRDKHREQFARLCSRDGIDAFAAQIVEYAGPVGHKAHELAVAHDWEKVEQSHRGLRRGLVFRALRRRKAALWSGLARLTARIARRWMSPPGQWIVFEGADGSGKSTVIRECSADLKGSLSCGGPVYFHWKPNCLYDSLARATPVDPRESRPRIMPLGLMYLLYHWFGFHCGWWLRVRPQLARNRLVIADRYAYDLYLDPSRFRLRLPKSILRLAIACVPRPDLVIALVGTPAILRERKPELTLAEIAAYQDRLRELAAHDTAFRVIDADARIADVRSAVMWAAESRFPRSRNAN